MNSIIYINIHNTKWNISIFFQLPSKRLTITNLLSYFHMHTSQQKLHMSQTFKHPLPKTQHPSHYHTTSQTKPNQTKSNLHQSFDALNPPQKTKSLEPKRTHNNALNLIIKEGSPLYNLPHNPLVLLQHRRPPPQQVPPLHLWLPLPYLPHNVPHVRLRRPLLPLHRLP